MTIVALQTSALPSETMTMERKTVAGGNYAGRRYSTWRSWLCELPGSSFNSAYLQRAVFNRCNLSGSDFRYADLRYTDFRYANLNHALFDGALLDGATFAGATVDGATYGVASLRHHLTRDAIEQYTNTVTVDNLRVGRMLPPVTGREVGKIDKIDKSTGSRLTVLFNAYGLEVIKVVQHRKTHGENVFTAVLICRSIEKQKSHAAYIAGRIRALGFRIIKHGINIELTASEWRNTPMVTFRTN